MIFRDELILTDITNTISAMGDPLAVETDVTVFADKKSVGQKEYFQAAAQGLRPEFVFVVRTADYNQQPMAKWNSKRYRVYRTFDRSDEFTELYLQGVTNGVI